MAGVCHGLPAHWYEEGVAMLTSRKLVVTTSTPGISLKERVNQARAKTRARKETRDQKSIVLPGKAIFPMSKMPVKGWKKSENLCSVVRADPPVHRTSSRVLGTAFPFLAESGEMMQGPCIGENTLSGAPFCLDPWEAYAAGIVRSHSVAILGVKGTGKSMLAKSWATRLCRMGRSVAVPHDPNGEWGKVAEYVGGKVISVGPGTPGKINLLDTGNVDTDLSDDEWERMVLQDRRATIKGVVGLLRGDNHLPEWEHTIIDEVLEGLTGVPEVTVRDVYERLRSYETDEAESRQAAARLAHALRRLVYGDLAGLFDQPSTVHFDSSAPMMVVNTSSLKTASPETQALTRLATARWVRNATTGSNRRPRVIVHEEAAIALMNDVAGGAGLDERVANEKVARHDGVSNWYLLHRISDLDALGDRGSAVQTKALGLLADCDTRVSYAQHTGEISRSQRVLGWNETQAQIVRRLKNGEGLWQVGPDRMALVKNVLSEKEFRVFRTDSVGGERQ